MLTMSITNVNAQEDNVNIQEENVIRNEITALRQELDSIKGKIQEDSLANELRLRYESIWGKKSSPWIIMYGSSSFQEEDAQLKLKSSFALGISKRRTFYLHSKPIAGMVKIGLDATWLEVFAAKYPKGKGESTGNIMGNVTEGTYNSYDDYFNAADKAALGDREVANLEGLLNTIDVGKWQLNFSALGIGPSVKVVPFYALHKPVLDKIKLTAYFHYVPTFTLFMLNGGGDTSLCISGGYLGQMRYGLNLSFGRFGIGFEQQWGKGKLTNYSFDEDASDNDFGISTRKSTYKTSSTRFYVGICF